MNIWEENGFIPVIKQISRQGGGRAKIVFLADLHICMPQGKIEKASEELIATRHRDFSTPGGMRAEESWHKFCQIIDDAGADLVVIAGDALDFCSRENVEELRAGLRALRTPYLYLRADHDSCPYWLEGVTGEECLSLQNSLCDNGEVITYEFENFRVVGINHSTEQMTATGLAAVKSAFSDRKPVLLVTHVPLFTEDGLLEKQSAAADWKGRSLVWGKGDYYDPDAITEEYLDLVFSENSPVFCVVGGHLHFGYDGKMNDRIEEIIFPAAAFGNIGILELGESGCSAFADEN